MNCPYCNNEVPLGTTHCPSCGGVVPNISPTSIPATTETVAISTKFAWILALLPIAAELLLVVLGGIALVASVSLESLQMIGLLVLGLYFVANLFVLHKDEKLLAEAQCREKMLLFMRIGIFFIPVYLCARAAKIDKKWAYAIVGSLGGVYWWWGWIFN